MCFEVMADAVLIIYVRVVGFLWGKRGRGRKAFNHEVRYSNQRGAYCKRFSRHVYRENSSLISSRAEPEAPSPKLTLARVNS